MMNPKEPNYGQSPPAPPAYPSYGSTQQIAPSYNQTPPAAVNPYDFIVNPQGSSHKSSLSGRSQTKKLLLITVVIASIILVVGMVVVMLLPKGTSSTNLVGIAQQQQEIVRIAALCERQAATEDTKGFCYTTELSISTSLSQLTEYINDTGADLDLKQMNLKQDPATDKTLDAAKATSTFDAALHKVLTAELETYLSDVQDIYKSTNNQKLRELLRQSFDSGKVLYDQAKTLQSR
ncbi:hypothetical protein IPL85_02400 [Candidatus Saccharibacteria bacterium]|nr:MAG: hypothetical protein IPL85_02400 [Candidatus Saccharibacteria bacterium]